MTLGKNGGGVLRQGQCFEKGEGENTGNINAGIKHATKLFKKNCAKQTNISSPFVYALEKMVKTDRGYVFCQIMGKDQGVVLRQGKGKPDCKKKFPLLWGPAEHSDIWMKNSQYLTRNRF